MDFKKYFFNILSALLDWFKVVLSFLHSILMTYRYAYSLYTRIREKQRKVYSKSVGIRIQHSRMHYSENAHSILKDWFEKNQSHPYATKEQKNYLSEITKLSEQQVTRWLINERQKKPSVPIHDNNS